MGGMEGAVKVVKNFQNVALVTTAGAIAYYWLSEPTTSSSHVHQNPNDDDNPGKQRKEPHSLTGQVVDPSKQVKTSNLGSEALH